jgi:hypothetical protein
MYNRSWLLRHLTADQKEMLKADIASLLHQEYHAPNGEKLEAQTVRFVIQALRDGCYTESKMRWRIPGNDFDFASAAEELGFRFVEDCRAPRYYRGGKLGLGAPARVLALKAAPAA